MAEHFVILLFNASMCARSMARLPKSNPLHAHMPVRQILWLANPGPHFKAASLYPCEAGEDAQDELGDAR